MRPLHAKRTVRGLASLLLAWLLVTGAAPTRAEDPELTIRDAMSRARAQSHEVAAARSRVESGEQRLRQAKGYRLPNLSFHEIWMRTDSPAEAFALQLNQKRFDFGDFVMGDPNNPDPIENALTRFELMQPVYTTNDHGQKVLERLEPSLPGQLSEAQYDQQVADLVNFLDYVGEPIKQKREQLGFWVLAFLVIFFGLSYALKKEYWRDIH